MSATRALKALIRVTFSLERSISSRRNPVRWLIESMEADICRDEADTLCEFWARSSPRERLLIPTLQAEDDRLELVEEGVEIAGEPGHLVMAADREAGGQVGLALGHVLHEPGEPPDRPDDEHHDHDHHGGQHEKDDHFDDDDLAYDLKGVRAYEGVGEDDPGPASTEGL